VISKPACIHRVLDKNVQEFTMKEVSRRALDELFDITEQNLQASMDNDYPDLVRPVLIDSSVGVQSLNYSLIRLRAMVSRFPARRNGRIAIILPASPLIRTISMMMRPIAPMRIYAPHEREAALSWLTEPVEAGSHR
jgi:hypothetical protein